MKNNSLLLLKAIVALLVLISFLTSCASQHNCGGICINHGKKMSKYNSIKKNSNPYQINFK